jgi:mRNA interferase MazF
VNYRWGIFTANLGPVIDSAQQGNRTVIVVSDETYNTLMPVVTVLPLAYLKANRKIYPNETLLPAKAGGLARDAIALAHQVRTISKKRLSAPLGYVEDPALHVAITETLKVHFNLA